MPENQFEYGASIIISLAALEFGLFASLTWFWSGFPWSPFGYETCGLEILAMFFFAYPAFVFGMLIRGFLLIRWKFPHFVWYLPLLLCGSVCCIWFKSFEMGLFCISAMLLLPVIDWIGCRKAARR